MVLRNYLKPFPFEITETEDGQETEDTLQKSNFSIAFLDIEMPKKHGTEIAKNIRGNKNAPILIACTGLCMPEEKQKILGSGFEFFFPKPYIKEELYTILSEITKRII
jgi:CheY-like chemotaxis protein